MGNNCPNFCDLLWGLDLDVVYIFKSLDVQIKKANCAKKCMRAVGWTGLGLP